MPNISIIIPTYNRGYQIKNTLSLILTQRFQDYEIIIVDDGSDDNTKDIVSLFNDTRFRYVFQQNNGVCAARNRGAELATANYLLFLDSDDSIEKNWLIDFYKKISENDYDLICCGVNVHKNKISNKNSAYSEKIDCYEINKRLLAGSFAIKKELFFTIGQYDPAMNFGENTELSIRLQAIEKKVGYIESINLNYYPAADGGGRNLKNRATSNIYFLNKHKDWFNNHKRVHRLYLQSTAVAMYKLSNFNEAKKYFFKAWKNNPFYLKGLLRLIVCHIPILAKSIWKKEMNNG